MRYIAICTFFRCMVMVSITLMATEISFAQVSAVIVSSPESPPALSSPDDTATDLDRIAVVGSRIQGAPTTDALPVVVLSADTIDAVGALSGDELMRSIPQMGDVLFDASNNPQTSNAARGDVNSVNLRSLGVGNTLVLLNGRRLVAHPTSQGTTDTGTVPVQSFNSNTIPVSGVDRMEILLDGAAAIYGADAVAGVVNTIMQTDFDGVNLSTRYGMAEGTSMHEWEANVFAGRNFYRGNISVFLNYVDRSALYASDQIFTRYDDLRPLFTDYADFAGIPALDRRAANTPWARLTLGARPVVRSNGTAVTNAAGAFRVQPEHLGCAVTLGEGICLAAGNHNFNTTHREMRYDTRHETTVRPSVERFNAWLTGHYSVNERVEIFTEIGLYRAISRAVQPPVINLNSIWIPASNYYNPFGALRLPDGTPNPNRLPDLTDVPDEGLPVQMTNYRYVDAGFQHVRVKNEQSRFLAGLRGQWWGLDWESALTWSEATAEDRSPNINMTALQQQLALASPDAYNPFSGGCATTLSWGDCSPSSQTAIDAIRFDLLRKSRTTLAMADLRMSRSDAWHWPAGDAGIAFGAEARRETQDDDRDENLDGSINFVDRVSGQISISNVAAVSPNPDTSGSRNVASAWIEFALPLVAPEMDVPLIRRLNMQVAARYEHYSDFGSVAKPKFALALDIVEGVRLRGSYSEGFRAPNLEQTNASQYARLATGMDYLRCEADLRSGRILSMVACGQNTSGVSLLVSGNPGLKPEQSSNTSFGLVLQPSFMPEHFGAFTFSVDRWRIRQQRIVGLLGSQTALIVDYLDRVQGGENPLVQRDAPTPEDIAFFADTGITPVGRVNAINDSFTNLLPQTAEGLDFSINWSLRRTQFGNFNLVLNATRLLEFTRDPGEEVNRLYAARAAGVIDSLTPLPDSNRLIGQNGRPQWRASGALTWNAGAWRAGISAQYIDAFEQPALLGRSGHPWEVDSRLVFNSYGQYRFADGTTLRLGVRDLTDKGPPLADRGYRGSVHQPWGRYWYVNLNWSF